ncbi:hypothetical protein ACU8KH_01434 [Lachancea thermotolerans]
MKSPRASATARDSNLVEGAEHHQTSVLRFVIFMCFSLILDPAG